ncbi:hypothetical protein ACFQU2_24860 [Siccirubricoccus deserti]
MRPPTDAAASLAIFGGSSGDLVEGMSSTPIPAPPSISSRCSSPPATAPLRC